MRARARANGSSSGAMTDLPSGTVTFLFTDIEGSTRLLHQLGDQGYGEALDDHRRWLRDAFARNGGVEVDTQGDAFFGGQTVVSASTAELAQDPRLLDLGM